MRKDATRRPFDRVLVANRGEIALRVIRACRDLGMEVVAVYSDADADAAHVRAADYAVWIGPAPPGESYLRGETIVEAALGSGAQAIHPGYGFLAERASFGGLVETAGLVFVGPTAAAIAALGDKLAARRAAAAAGVPLVAGTLQPAAIGRPDELPALVAEAEAIGFPLLVKASAGGGGRGMRRVERVAELPAALVAASAEASSTFGDGTVYLEREIRPARHVEVQLLGDVDGRVVAIGERDCSIQRRHQKLLEECPAPGLTADERRYVHDLATRAARSVGLTNAATAEFLYEGDSRFSFLEVNARLQVEHGITELVTGLDLVVEQFRLAAGWPLSSEASAAAAASATPAGHAIEVRLSAEDPAREFVPAPGRVGRWKMPAGPGIRVDTATRAGDRVPPDYDPLIAKIMAHGRDRNEAIARLRRALDEVEVTGIQTTLPFHRAVLADPAFRAARLSTDWVGERWDGPADRRERLDVAQLAAGLAVIDGSLQDRRPGLQATAEDGRPLVEPDGRRTDGRRPGAPTGARDGQEVLPLQRGLDGHAPGWRRAGREAMLERWPR